MGFVGQELEPKLAALGFVSKGLGMELTVGTTRIQVVDGPSLMISLSRFGPRSMCSYDVKCPRTCSKEQIAGLIYLNMNTNFREDVEVMKAHLQSLGVPLFQ